MTEVNGAAVVADLDKMISRIAELESENEALWAFVAACDAEFRVDWWKRVPSTDKGHTTNEAREALCQYEKKPFTYDPDAPLKLA